MVSEAVHANYSVELLEKLTIVRCDVSESSVENFLLEKTVAHHNHRLADERRLLTSRMLAMKQYVRYYSTYVRTYLLTYLRTVCG